MTLNQVNENFNDVFETFFPKMNPIKGRFLTFVNKLLLRALKWRRKFFSGKIYTTERIVEYPTIFQWIKPNSIVLDIGCVSSRLPLQLASLGHEVHGLDVRTFPLNHPNFHFHKVDILQWIPEKKFDTIILVSTLEHFGLGGYDDIKKDDADFIVINKIKSWLNQGSQLLVTLPFGKYGITKKHRVYDLKRLQNLFDDFLWIDQKYFKRIDTCWIPSKCDELKNIESPKLPPNGVALLYLQKK